MLKLDRRWLLTLVVVLAIILAVFRYWAFAEQILKTIWRASLPFIGGAMLAYVVNILMSGYERAYRRLFRSKFSQRLARPVSLVLAYATFLILLLILLGIVIPELVESIQGLIALAPRAIQNLVQSIQENKWLNKTLNQYFGSDASDELSRQINEYTTQILNGLGTFLLGLLNSVTDIFSTLLNIFMAWIFSLYVLASKEELGLQFHRLLATYFPKLVAPFENVRQIFHQSFRSFFIGQTTEAIILGTLTFVGMLIFNFPYASTVSILVGFSAMIPVVGAYIGVTVGVILIMTQSFSQAMWFLAFIVILQQFEGNLIYPRVVGNSVGLPGMWVILAITVGGALGGIFGMLVAVPFLASCYKLIKQDVQRREAENRAIG
ncbi:putative PurR-regulated permease PerM [Streptococcus rupicaprae]|uniref:PurR-regulated permease PerM n=1 Tax=Streptococcus rupicaprae TaxID=759619 RepID=A0ABV2FJW0_9STRE